MDLAFPWSRESLRQEAIKPSCCNGMPREYSVLEVLTRNHDSAVFNGKAWVPSETSEELVTFRSLMDTIGDPIVISAALDDLLDSGLLRAKDAEIAPTGPEYSRVFLAGGEYNALQVSRVARSCRAVMASRADTVEESDFDHWFDR
jgi:hypothetical protein